MSSETAKPACVQAELVSALAMGALSAEEASTTEAHVRMCALCEKDLESMRAVVGSFAAWPMDVLRPTPSLWNRLVQRMGKGSAEPVGPAPITNEPDWDEVAPGLGCRLLATDTENARVSMLVRLSPGAEYPPHTHAGVEELHLLDGELWIDDRKLFPGDYHRAESGTADERVWSETGCTCVLITSINDRLTEISASVIPEHTPHPIPDR